jgi:hypothetical protein
MGREGSFLLSQELAIVPRPAPDESSPHPPNPFFGSNFNTITFTPRSSLVASFSSGFLSAINQFSAAPDVPHAQPSPFRAPRFDEASNIWRG